MIHVSIQYEQYRSYTQSSDCIIAGEAFYQGGLYKDEHLLSLITAWKSEEQFIEGLKHLNGFYSLIKHYDQKLLAAVDRVRSIPLFYGQKGNDFFLSDSAEWVRQKIGNQEMDPLAREEFLLTGYVTGPDTLFPDVKQLQAGEAIIVKDTEQGLSVIPVRYYRFIHEYEHNKSMEGLLEEYDQVILRVFKRLIQVADGRTIVVPLSGGYDSRLIVLMLKRLGYGNVVTFSYGRPGNKESEVSRKVAELLELRWEFVPYSNEEWYKWFKSEERLKFWQFASGLCSLGHIQDWPAVWQLKNNNIIPDDSIFVPGHSADLPAGSRSTAVRSLYVDKPIRISQTIAEIFKYHYCLFDWTKKREQLESLFVSKINQTLGHIEHFPDSASAFESWDIAERQAKFIINSLRVYEFWGYRWWMPFWDYEHMHFWSTVSLEYRIKQAMYKLFVDNLFYKTTGLILPRDDLNPSFKHQLKNLLIPYMNDSLKAKLKILLKSNKRVLINEYNTQPQAWWGIYTLDEYLLNAKDYTNINSALVKDYIDCLTSTL